MAVFTRAPLIQFADSVGDGTGSIDAIGDYSGGEASFKLIPPPGLVYVFEKFHIIIADVGTMDSGGYGNNGANPLTNGVNFEVRRNGATLVDFTGGRKIKTNSEWAMYFDELVRYDFGSGDEYLVIRLDEARLKWPRWLDSRTGDQMHFTVNDDLTFLTKHRCLGLGNIIPVEYFNPDDFI
jgi:hypothetical protein